MSAVLAAEDLAAGYGGRTVLSGCDLTIAPGEAVALIGPNGAGKSTLLRALAGLLPPSSGRALVAGRPAADWPRRELARRLAYLPQDAPILFPFRVVDVALMGRYPHHRVAPAETAADVAAARDALERVGLWDLRDRRIDELSGGERRLALLARAFCQQAEVLLLDEPTASLDVAHAAALVARLADERRRRGLTVVMATHDFQVALRAHDRALLLHGGRIARDGRVEDVLASRAAADAFAAPLHLARVPESAAPFCVPR